VSAVLGEALALGASRLVVDLGEATFSESEGLGALLDAARAVRPRDGLVALIAARSSELRQILATTGLEPAFVLYETRRAAFDDLGLDDPPA
jgi:anti-anti-sigma factor